MSPQQTTYAQVRALYDATMAEVEKRYKAITPQLARHSSDAELVAYCNAQAAIDNELQRWQIHDSLRVAEDALVDWALETVKNDPKTHRQYLRNSILFSGLATRAKRYPALWPKLVEICFNLDA